MLVALTNDTSTSVYQQDHNNIRNDPSSGPRWLQLGVSTAAHKKQKLTIKAGIRELQNDRCQDQEELKWQKLFQDPSMWWDNRKTKWNPKYPDFKHTSTGQSLWIDSRFCPEWVPSKLKCLEINGPALGRGMRAHYRRGEDPSFHGGRRSHIGNAVHKKLPHPRELSLIDNTKCGQDREPLRIYENIRQEGMKPSISIVLAALKVCSSLRDLQTGKKIHADVIESGEDSDIYVANTLVDMYAKCGSMVDARQVFDRISHHSVVSWNAIILGYAQSGEGELALQLYACMQDEGCAPDSVTSLAALKACGSLAAKQEGKQVEGKLVKLVLSTQVGHELDIFVAATLIDMYAKCGSLVDAQGVFDRMPNHNVVLWTTIILGYVQSGEGELALQLYARMQGEGCAPDSITFVAAMRACGSLAVQEEGKQVEGKLVKPVCLEKGRAIHSQAAKSGSELDIYGANTLVDMYAKCGSLADAQGVFDRMPNHSVVSWNTIILGYAENGEGELALQLFARMQDEGCAPVTFIAALKACGILVALETGKKMQVKICSAGFKSDAVLCQMKLPSFQTLLHARVTTTNLVQLNMHSS